MKKLKIVFILCFLFVFNTLQAQHVLVLSNETNNKAVHYFLPEEEIFLNLLNTPYSGDTLINTSITGIIQSIDATGITLYDYKISKQYIVNKADAGISFEQAISNPEQKITIPFEKIAAVSMPSKLANILELTEIAGYVMLGLSPILSLENFVFWKYEGTNLVEKDKFFLDVVSYTVMTGVGVTMVATGRYFKKKVKNSRYVINEFDVVDSKDFRFKEIKGSISTTVEE